jgi:hypothetical protein
MRYCSNNRLTTRQQTRYNKPCFGSSETPSRRLPVPTLEYVMHTHLSTRFACNSHVIRSNSPLTDEQIRFVAPSVYASEQHSSRSDRYSYIPTKERARNNLSK